MCVYIKHVRYIGGEKLRKTLPSSRKIGMDDHHLEAMYETRTTQRSQCPSGGLSRSQMNQRTNVGLDEARDRRGKKKTFETSRRADTSFLLTRLKRDASRRSRNDIQRDEGRIENEKQPMTVACGREVCRIRRPPMDKAKDSLRARGETRGEECRVTGVEEEEASHESNGHPTCQEFLAVDLPSSTRVFGLPSVRLSMLRPPTRGGTGRGKRKGGRERRRGGRGGCKREQQSLNKHKVQLKS